MIFDILWNIILGVTGGIISSVIVSRVFLIQGDNQKQLELLETNINKISYIHGELSVIKKVAEIIHDQEIDMRNRVEPYEGASDAEILSSQRIMDDLQSEILGVLKKDIDKTNVELDHIFLVNQEAMVVIKSCLDYVQKIQAMKNCSFAVFDELDKLWNNANKQFENYAISNKKRLLKQIATDRIMLVLYIIVFLIVIGAVAAKYLGIWRLIFGLEPLLLQYSQGRNL